MSRSQSPPKVGCSTTVPSLQCFLRTFFFGSDNGRSLSHLLKARPARVGSMFWESHGLSVVVPTSNKDGSKLGGAGGAGLFEVLMKAAWMGVAGGLDADCPGTLTWIGCIVSQFLTELCQLASELRQLMLCIRVSCTSRNPAIDEICT